LHNNVINAPLLHLSNANNDLHATCKYKQQDGWIAMRIFNYLSDENAPRKIVSAPTRQRLLKDLNQSNLPNGSILIPAKPRRRSWTPTLSVWLTSGNR